MITMGIHDIDMDQNIAVGDRYEDVTYHKRSVFYK
jgi:hypothetical protein